MQYCCTIDVVTRKLPNPRKIRYPEVRKRLLELMQEDQEDRLPGKFWSDPTKLDPRLIDQWIKRDTARAEEMLKLLQQIKTPSARNIGLDGSRAVWIIALHCTSRRDIAKLVLKKMKALYYRDRTQVFYPGIPYLVDAIMLESAKTAEKMRQLYGTQGYYDKDGRVHPYPVINPAKLSDRRAKFGLSSGTNFSNKRCKHRNKQDS